MNLLDYKTSIPQFARYPVANERQYLALGLVSEVGELAGKLAKRLRSDDVSDEDVISELGDVIWFTFMIRNRYNVGLMPTVRTFTIRHADHAIQRMFECAAQVYTEMPRDTVTPITLCMLEDCVDHLARLHQVTLDEVAEANYQKLASRAQRGVLQGNGDHR